MTGETIAIIGGAGELGFGLALRWARAGYGLRIGSREAAKAQAAAGRVKAAVPGAAIEGFANPEAVRDCGIAVIAVPFAAQAGIVKSLKPVLTGRIVVDTSVPLATAIGGRPTRMLGVWEGSAAEQAQALLPGVTVLSAFHNVSAESLQDMASVPDCDVLISGGDAAAKERLSVLVNAIAGLRALDAGPLEMSRVTESLAALLISLNRRYKVHGSGLRISGISL